MRRRPAIASAAEAPSLTAIVLTFEDEMHIGRCIERLRPVARRILVIDSNSSDATVAIARAAGAEVHCRPFTGYSDQYNWAARNNGIDTDWILWVDSDEYLEPSLIGEIRERLPRLPPRVTAVDLRRKVIFKDRWIRWGGHYDTVLTRLWRPGCAHVEERWMDIQLQVTKGETASFTRGDIVDENLKDITAWTAKHNRYTTLQMVDFLSHEFELGIAAPTTAHLTGPTRRKRVLRNGLYRRSPLYLRAVLYYLYRYILRLGFLDGRQGFVFHTLQGFWNFLLVDVKIDEARREISRNGLDAFIAGLSSRHGVHLTNTRHGGHSSG